MNARLDSMYEVVRGQKQNSAADDQRIENLLKEVEKLRLAQSSAVRNDGASTSRPVVCDDALLARIMHEHEEIKAKLDAATTTNQRVETLEASLKSIKQQHEEALQEAEDWKKETLKSGNKRSRMATSPSSQLKVPSSAIRRPVTDTSQLTHLYTLEVNALKELRLQELNR
ncbi:hypothetical protein CBR_g37035 [Chara braunii]|uniref:Uncharacterized protein n=1 Tax=Chara braunii TaxID=69332 RepID=A0A388LM82_CHABU|nr:hypothetical protein CBR_g37035 [Chara braunii]|eukprot:GBG83322.1 hypothetical protein CBR_g37035 [Chara braunii]